MIVNLKHDELKKCLNFAKKAALNQNSHPFGEWDQPGRSYDEKVRDTFVGKIGEVAFEHFIIQNEINAYTNFIVYEPGECDKDDFYIDGWKIDVKTTEYGDKFFISWNSLKYRISKGELPHYYVIAKLQWDVDLKLTLPQGGKVEIVGFVDLRDLNFQNDLIETIHKGEELFVKGKNTKVAVSDFFAIRMNAIDDDWEAFFLLLKEAKPFSTAVYVAPGVIQGRAGEDQTMLATSEQYSLTISTSMLRKFNKDFLKDKLQQGRKVFLFLSDNDGDTGYYKKIKNEYPYLILCYVQVSKERVPELLIEDGKTRLSKAGAPLDAKFRLLIKNSKDFNFEQYKVEHAGVDLDIIVKASAGTGKTTVMIDRVMFLLATVPELRPKDICLVTFTNKAAEHMTEKLQEKLAEYYKCTKDIKYLSIIEELSDMQIKTIDSFFKDIVTSEGSRLGYGTSVGVRGFTFEKQNIIREIVNEIYQESGQDKFIGTFILSINDYEKLALKCWNTLSSRGFYPKNEDDLDFGFSERDEIINKTLKQIVIRAQKAYQDLKLSSNAIAVDDIKAEMDAITKLPLNTLRNTEFKYLFVDEFQDTDNSQIDSIAWISKILQCQLFVVGDIKQSIYRFRGATESAFERLKSELGVNNYREHVLVNNYRTDYRVLNKLNVIFNNWGDLLHSEEDTPPAVATRNFQNENCVFEILNYRNKLDLPSKFEQLSRNIIPDNGNGDSVCILSRTNNNVKETVGWCRALGLACRAKLDGGFYHTKPVVDIHALLGALLYPDNPVYLYNVFLTPFFSVKPSAEKISELAGNTEKLASYFTSLLNQESWDAFLQDAKQKPVFMLLRDIVNSTKPESKVWENLKQEKKKISSEQLTDLQEAEIRNEVEFYNLNINKLFRILYEHFSGEFASLHGVYDFLSLRMSDANDTEDAVYPENNDARIIECMTIHKAKGLEFDTVVITHTNTPFMWEKDITKSNMDIITNDDVEMADCLVKVGWLTQRAAGANVDKEDLREVNKYRHFNQYYEDFKETEANAIRKEETRILYVALTRAMKRLYCFVPFRPQDDTWAKLIKTGR